jgi:hypothetical protein
LGCLAVDNSSDWTKKVAGAISKTEEQISPSDQRRYQLPLLLRLARRVAAFSPECEVCQSLQSQIIDLGENLADVPLMTRQSFKNYLDVVEGIARHLKRTHGLVEERQYVKRCVLIGLTFGLSLVLLGLILLNFGITLLALNITLTALVTRVVFGYTVGYFLDRRARKRGRVL